MSDVAAHWDGVYGTRPADTVSWYEPRPVTSLRLIQDASQLRGPVVDVGAGASFLADALVGDGWEDVTVLDVSAEALEVVRQRAGGRQVVCIATDLLVWRPDREYAVWHDRAVFHFLTDPGTQQQYVAVAASAVRPGGAVVVGVFAEDGPTHCSGLRLPATARPRSPRPSRRPSCWSTASARTTPRRLGRFSPSRGRCCAGVRERRSRFTA